MKLKSILRLMQRWMVDKGLRIRYEVEKEMKKGGKRKRKRREREKGGGRENKRKRGKEINRGEIEICRKGGYNTSNKSPSIL